MPLVVLRRAVRLWGGALAAALLVAGCGGPGEEPGRTPSPSVDTPSATPTPLVSRLTGLPVADGPVLAVKIDNTAAARPRIGIGQADLVYVEPVEGGLTRLLAVFSTALPAEVGPVRSARASDGRILDGWAGVAFADSGASRLTNSELRTADFSRVSFDTSAEGYRRDRSRRAPHNVVGDPAALIARAGGSGPPPQTGFVFGAAPTTGTPASAVTVGYRASRIGFEWSAGEKRWLLSTDGKPDVDAAGGRNGAATVVVQEVTVTDSDNRDVNGAPTPLLTVTGTGAATVLRDGQSFAAEWSRPEGGSATTFTTGTASARVPMTFAPGPVWVVLVSSQQTVTVG